MLWPAENPALQIVGVDDPHTDHSDFTKAYEEADPNIWTLLLCHSPDGARELAGRRADLMLCGHTHGGAIRIPPIGALIHGTTHVKGLVAGWYEHPVLTRRSKCPADRTRLYVSKGLGMSSWRFRFNCRPDMPVFRLRSGAKREIVRTAWRVLCSDVRKK
jgi:predicted MPP superfamily phosphohydrolase